MAPPPPEVAEIIRRKKLQYGRFVDTKQWSRMTEIALPEARLAFLNPDGTPITVGKRPQVFDSLDAYCTKIGKALTDAKTFHMLGHGELDQTGPDEVQAIFGIQDMFELNGVFGLINSIGGGHYHETWRRNGDDWFMVDLRLERTCVKTSFVYELAIYISKVVEWLGFEFNP